jgi:hypothetical protein
MTVGELERRMDSKELSEWVAYTRHFEAIPDSWRETGLIVSAMLAPYSRKGQSPRPEDFIPIESPPQHPEQMRDAIDELNRRLGVM